MRQRRYGLLLLLVSLVVGLPAASAHDRQTPSRRARRDTIRPIKQPYYANTPADIIPYRRMVRPYHDNFYATPQKWLGPGRDEPEPRVDVVKIGFLGPARDSGPLAECGRHMLQGARLAIEQANAQGGYRGKPFQLVVKEDKARWGDSSNTMIELYGKDRVWGILGSMDSANSHVMMRAALKFPMPIVNSATTDQTLMEHRIPFILRNIPDDRQYSYATARYLFREKNYRYVALFRLNNRDGRFSVKKLTDAARRMGRPFVIDQRFTDGETDFTSRLQRIRSSPAEAVVVWGNPREVALILKQMRQMGMKHPVIGWFRSISPILLKEAGPAAEGMVCAYPFDPSSNDTAWRQFQRQYRKRFGEEPEVFAAFAYDGMNLLIGAIRKAGLNRIRIADALGAYKTYQGVTGPMIFDGARNNVRPIYLAEVRGNRFLFRPASLTQSASSQTPAQHTRWAGRR